MRKPLPFGKYLLLDRVAVGGMAEVFAAKSFGVEGFERLIAIKRILPTMVEDDEFVAMFLDEARITARLNHATIAQIYELGKHEETYFIAMEYVSGRDVRLIIDKFRKRNESVPLSLAAFITARIAESLDYAHNKTDEHGEPLGIIHRDISPQNVLVSYDGEVKLIDFGIAKAAGRNQKTQVGILKGKFAYMSPEQVRGVDIDHRSDLFSVGVMLYEMITGVKLFSGESDFSTLEKVRAGDVRSPSELNPSIPEELERVVLKALAKEREDRYQSGAELCDDLMRFLYQEGSVFSSKSLARFMSETFADELKKESERQRRWWITEIEEASAEIEPEIEASPPKAAQKVRIGSAADAPPLEDADLDEAVVRQTATPPRPVDDQETRVGPVSVEGQETRVGPQPVVEDQATRVGPAPEVEDQATRVGPAPASGGAEPATAGEVDAQPENSTVIIRNPTAPPPVNGPPPRPPPSTPPPVRQVILPPQTPPPDRRRSGNGGMMGIAATAIILAAGGLLAVQFLKPGGIAELISPAKKGVVINVTPPEALVELDGKELAEKGHFVIRPEPGSHRLRVSALHYQTMEHDFSVPADTEINVRLDPEPQPAAPVVAESATPDAGTATEALPTATAATETPARPPPSVHEGHEGEQAARESSHEGTHGPAVHAPSLGDDKRKALEALEDHGAGSQPSPVVPPPPPPPPPPPQEQAASTGGSAVVPTTATLSLNTDPPGAMAKVIIGGKAKMVKTPIVLDKVPTAHAVPIAFVLSGYEKKEVTAELEAGQVVTISEKLVLKPSNKETAVIDTGGDTASTSRSTGTVSVLCFPVANIIIDGKNSGQRTSNHSVQMPLPTGHHSVSCATESGKTSAPLEFDLASGQTVPYKARVQ